MNHSITINKLIENLHTHTTNLSDTKEKIKQMVTTALLQAVSDVNPTNLNSRHTIPRRSKPVLRLCNLPRRIRYKICKAWLKALLYFGVSRGVYYLGIFRNPSEAELKDLRTHTRET